MPTFALQVWENEDGPRGATNTVEGLTHSSDLGREGLGMKPTRTCQHPDGCTRPHKGRGWCRGHLDRLRRSGDVGPASIKPQAPADRTCAVDDCGNSVTVHGARGMCNKHYLRWRKHGDPLVVGVGGASLPGAANPNWSGDDATYNTVHLRLRKQRGCATDYPCADCGEAAAHWSYNNLDPDERIDPECGRYSVDLSFYEPRCVSCHRLFDNAARRP